LVGGLINQTNIYFPRTISAISLPDLAPQNPAIATLKTQIAALPTIGVARTIWNFPDHTSTVAMVKAGLAQIGVTPGDDDIKLALKIIFDAGKPQLSSNSPQPSNPESDFLAFRRAEFNIIRTHVCDPQNIPHLRVIPTSVPQDMTAWISKVHLVERLRETRAFYGFDRLEQNPSPLAQMPDIAMRQLFRDPPTIPSERWLPAVEVFGEGIYIELNDQRLKAWQAENASWLKHRLDDGYVNRLQGIFQTLPPLSQATREWASRYLLVHSFAHILINQFVFECGYSTASLRERLYVSTDPDAPMASLMIYTAAGDADGTLGGLVRLGRPEHLGPAVRRALGRASWCSADPICSEQLGGQGSRLVNLAACHCCILLPETSCETINQGLDRAMIVGTPESEDSRKHGFMADLLSGQYALGG
jgi:hypothetical protein